VSPLTTEGVLDELRRFRADKIALVALVGSMGAESEHDALARLREIRDLTSDQLAEMRRKGRGKRTREDALRQPIMQGVYELANEIEPWLAQLCARSS
jgi:hypothetical protein